MMDKDKKPGATVAVLIGGPKRTEQPKDTESEDDYEPMSNEEKRSEAMKALMSAFASNNLKAALSAHNTLMACGESTEETESETESEDSTGEEPGDRKPWR